MTLLPKWRGYRIRTEIQNVDEGSGANTHRLVRVPLANLDEWDATHDEAGFLRRRPAAAAAAQRTASDTSSRNEGIDGVDGKDVVVPGKQAY